MGHHLFVVSDEGHSVSDVDLAIFRGLFLNVAEALGLKETAEAIHVWEYCGPGVWINVEEETLQNQSELFDVAINILAENRGTYKSDWLQTMGEAQGTELVVVKETDKLIQRLRSLQEFLAS